VNPIKRLVRQVGRKLKSLVPEQPLAPGLVLTVVEDALDQPLRAAWCAPAFGVVFDANGRVFAETARPAQRLTPTLDRLPGARREDGETRLVPPENAPILPAGTVFMGWGAAHNYAQFLLGALPALLAARQEALARFPPIAPPLSPWHADLLALADAPAPIMADAPLVRLEEAMFLAAPTLGPGLDAVRERILAQVPPADARRLYVSRQGSLKAAQETEAWLEEGLAARGFAIIRPETASVRELVALFRGAEVVVAASGTILANVLFCAPGAKVIEIQPIEPAEPWVRDLAARVGATWRGFVSGIGIVRPEVPLEPRLRPTSAYGWRLDVTAFLAFLDGLL
jgi:capsular polysaccharide biosynthesis protein